MYKVFLSLLFLIPLHIGEAYSQAPKYSNEFLSIGVGAQALGMSNAFVARVNDVTAGYWNPAGLTALKSDVQIGYMHSEYFAGIANYDYGAIAARVDESTVIGITPLLRLGVDDIANTTELFDADGNPNYDRIKSFSVADYAFIFSYAKASKHEGLTYGANVKVIYRKVGEFATAWGFGLDVGAQYKLDKWRFGVMGRDITSTFNAWSFNTEKLKEVYEITNNDLPDNSLEITLPKIILGVGREIEFTEKLSLYPEIDLDLTFDGKRNVLLRSKTISIDPHMGFELQYRDFIFLRGGLGYLQQITDFDGSKSYTVQPNFGLGVKIRGISIDYALTNIGQSVGLLSNVFSFKVDINKEAKSS